LPRFGDDEYEHVFSLLLPPLPVQRQGA